MENTRAKELLGKYEKGLCDAAEKAIVETWFIKTLAGQTDDIEDLDYDAKEQEILQLLPVDPNASKTITLRPWIAAASIVLCLAIGGYYTFHKFQTPPIANYKTDIPPGHNQATLTLANGKKIILAKGLAGMLAQQGNTAIQISGNNITYTAGLPGKVAGAAVYNTLSTAKGEQSPYPLILADGSKVWLNAQSSITFPAAFSGKERTVKVTGEALFEVVHNDKQPFKVQTEKQTIEDIGTIFDVNAYSDEASTNTTLIEGRLKVNGMVLQPNQQTDGATIKTVETKRYTAWRNGDFYFEDDNIKTVMRQLSRWYNIDVSYEGAVTNEGFNAQISRNKNISGILHMLENTQGVHFKIEGRKITVIK